MSKPERRTGWFKVPNALVDDGLLAELTPGAVKVLLVLLRGADGKATVTRGAELIAQQTGLTKRAVLKVRSELREAGHIDYGKNPGGRKKRTCYTIKTVNQSSPFKSQKQGTGIHRLARETVNQKPWNSEPRAPRDRPTKTDKRQNTPTALDTPEFFAAWQEYEQYRQESNLRSLKPRSVQTQWKRMASWGSDVAIEAIRRTIANGWQGIFPPLDKGGRKTSGGTSGTASPEHLYKQIKVGKWSCATLADGTTIDLDAVTGWNEGGLTSNNKLIMSATAITETKFQ